MAKYALPMAMISAAKRAEPAARPRRDSGRDGRDAGARLAIGRSGDALEREADHASARALHENATTAQRRRTRLTTRALAEAAEADSPVWAQRTRALARERDRARRLTTPALAPDAVPTEAEVNRARRFGGAPLPATVRSEMEERLGHGLGDVRVHRGRRAADLAASLGARAFTVGQDVFFGGGTPAPDSAAARPMLAHELAHVGQQRAGRAGPAGAVAQRQLAEADTAPANEPAPAPSPPRATAPALAAAPAPTPATRAAATEPDDAEAPAAEGGPLPSFAIGLLKMGAFRVARKGKRAWQAAISARLARQLPASQVIMLATAAVGHEVLRIGDKDGNPTAPLPIDALLTVAEAPEVVEARVKKERPDRNADLALVTVHEDAIERMRERLGPQVTEVGLEKAARVIEPRQDFPESFPQGFTAGVAAEGAAEALPTRKFGLADFVLMQAGAQVGELEGVVKGIEGVVKQIAALFKPEFWTSLATFLFDTLPAILADDQLQFDIGFAHGVAFTRKLKGLAKLSPYELGRAIGEMIGELAVDVAITVLSAGAVAAVKKALEGARILEGLAGLRGLVGKLSARVAPKLAELEERFPAGFRAAADSGRPARPLPAAKGAVRTAEEAAAAEGAPARAAAPKAEPTARPEPQPPPAPQPEPPQPEKEPPPQLKVEPPAQPDPRATAARETESKAEAAAKSKQATKPQPEPAPAPEPPAKLEMPPEPSPPSKTADPKAKPARPPKRQAPKRPATAKAKQPTPKTSAEAEAGVPGSWQLFDARTHAEFKSRLQAFGGDVSIEPDREFRGGEGQLFFSDEHPTEALKRWYRTEVRRMPESIRRLEAAEQAVAGDLDLSANIEVVSIHETGTDWILRDFDPSSVPLRAVSQDPAIQGAVAAATKALERTSDPILKEILKRIRKLSANVHWSRQKKKLLIIDLQ
jgi:hypothetical protein